MKKALIYTIIFAVIQILAGGLVELAIRLTEITMIAFFLLMLQYMMIAMLTIKNLVFMKLHIK